AAAGQKTPPVLADNLNATISPAMALFFISFEAVGQQSPAVAAVGVMRAPAALEHGEPEIGIFADGVARPVAGIEQGGATHEAHGPVHDDGIRLVPLHH